MRRVPNRIVVDPPSGDVTRERIERRLFQTLAADELNASGARPLAPGAARGKRRMVWVAAIAGTVAAGAVGAFALFRSGPHRLDAGTTTGAVALRSGSRVITGPTERSHVSVGDASVEVGADSDVDVRHGATETLLVLTRGSVDCDVPHRAGRKPFEVAAGPVRVTVMGTRFSVARYAHTTRVAVTRGRVAVAVGGETWTVPAGEHWERAAEAAAEAPTMRDPGSAAVGSRPTDAQNIADPAGGRGANTPEPHLPAPSQELPLAPPPAPPPPAAVELPLPAAPAGTGTSTGAARAAALRSAAASARRADQAAAVTSSAGGLEELFNEALRLERHDPRRAAALYRQLARGQGPWAPIGLFSVAALAHAQGQLAETLAAATEYERRFPRGAHRQDVAWLRIDAFAKSGDRDQAAAAARDYLARYPSGPYATSAARLLR